MRARLYLSTTDGDLDALRRAYHREKLDRTVRGLWLTAGWVVGTLVAGSLAGALS